jgi:RNA polymerase sigma-70 factor, ECF subfamily
MGLSSPRPSIAQLVELHYQSLFRYAYRLTGMAGDAEDLTQETFCKAQAKWGQLRDGTQARAWLYSILRNAYLQRRRNLKHVVEVSLDDMSELAEVPEDSPWTLEPGLLQDALNRLPEEFRTPIILYYFEEFAYKEIADQIGVPLGTVMSRLARAKAWLRKQLVDGSTNKDHETKEANG